MKDLNSIKVRLMGHSHTIASWLIREFGVKTINGPDPEIPDVILFPGGLDVDPSLYGETVGQRTSFDSSVDQTWVNTYRNNVSSNVRFIGIGKGAQFLAVMSGAGLFQHVSGHVLLKEHDIIVNAETYSVNSTHHQMMNPYSVVTSRCPAEYEILAYSKERLSDVYLNGTDDNVSPPVKEPEVILFRNTNSLSIQFHPELMEPKSPINGVIATWIEMLMSNESEEFYDRYTNKVSREMFIKESKQSEVFDLGDIPQEVFASFVQQYIAPE